MSGGYCENDTNILLKSSTTLDHFCIQNDTLHTMIYIHITINADKITIKSHFNNTSKAGSLAYANA